MSEAEVEELPTDLPMPVDLPMPTVDRGERERLRVVPPLVPGVVHGAYPERVIDAPSKLDVFGDRVVAPVLRRLRARAKVQDIPERCAAHAAEMQAASAEGLAEIASELRTQLRERGFEDALVVRCFALVREISGRELGMRHHDVQLLGGWTLLQGMVAEMATGEGKTLAAALPIATAGLAGVPVHLITVNDYLAKRDAETLDPIYSALGLSVGVIVSGMDREARRAAYACDVTYCTNKEVAFDYLKDRIELKNYGTRLRLSLRRLARRENPSGPGITLIHRGLHFAIVDEADSVLVDEARTPLIISGRESDATEEEIYRTALDLARPLERKRDFDLDEATRHILLTDEGHERLEVAAEQFGGFWRGRRRREQLVAQALSALHLFTLDQQYLVDDDKVQIIDEYTGRVMPDRSWEQGLHQMIEVKEGVPMSGRQDTLARISYQSFFQRYLRLAGMSGTAAEVGGELWSTYRLPVVKIPTHKPCCRVVARERVLETEEEKWQEVVARVAELQSKRCAVLVGTRSVEASEHLGALLDDAGVPHCLLNARQDEEEAEIVARAGEPGRVTVATNMAGRGTDIGLADGVAELGGLHVIATERHDAGRIDRQLFGRSARQGDPGRVEAIVSLADPLCRTYEKGWGWVFKMARAADPDSAVGSRLRSFVLTQTQRQAGRLHARSRRDLIAQDKKLETLLAFSGRRE